MSTPVDLPRVRRTLARLSAHLEAHPEIHDRTARWLDDVLEVARRLEADERGGQWSNTQGAYTRRVRHP